MLGKVGRSLDCLVACMLIERQKGLTIETRTQGVDTKPMQNDNAK